MNKPKHEAGHQVLRFTRHDDPHPGPASLYGYVMATHDELVKTLGKPCKETGDTPTRCSQAALRRRQQADTHGI